ncbi:MAG TPA: PspC domain-containing protein [Acidimicrobiales bacterium]|nr:MAG: hypothetical protein B7X07_01630 [Actinobacteria bacterium 21-64-8]HQT98919.1 PspC domain-containing protein [Acidimicrobiales bacterium]
MSDATLPTDPVSESHGVRRSSSRLVGGVAGGLAKRLDVDVRLVRLMFVVATVLWGVGVALYLVLWAILPSEERPDDAVVPPSKRLSVSLAAGAVAIALLAIAAWRSLRFVAPGTVLIWLFLLVGLAILSLRAPSRRLSVRRFIGFVFLGAMSVVIVLSGAFLTYVASTGVPLQGGNGYHLFQPSSLATTQHNYRTMFGVTDLDLSQVRFPVTGYVVNASAAVGKVVVVVPANAIVSLKTNIGIGQVSYRYWRRSPSPSIVRPITPNVSTLPVVSSVTNAPRLTLNVQVGVGQLLISRAAPSH